MPKSAASLLELIGKKIKRAENRGSGEIRLYFESGDVINVRDENANGESYEI